MSIVIGMTYMVMDVFIRQYTRKNSFDSDLNPLMRGVTIGILVNVGLLVIIVGLLVYFLLTLGFMKWSPKPKTKNCSFFLLFLFYRANFLSVDVFFCCCLAFPVRTFRMASIL